MWLLVLFLQFSSLPNVTRTPGSINPLITQDNIKDTICNKAWSTRMIRPSSAYTTKLKKKQMKDWFMPGSPKDYEEDHLIPLELGGNPINEDNLWPEAYSPKPGAHEKDEVENFLHNQVCLGKMPLAEAQRAISTNWLAIYQNLHKK